MKLVLAEPRYFKDSISIISELVTEVKFKAGPNGLKLVAMDPANVAMVNFELFSSSFTEYDVKEEEEISINLNSLKQILRRAKGEDVLTLETTEDNKLKIQMKSGTTRSFSIPTLEIEDKEQKVPDLSFPIVIEAHSEVLSDAIEDVSVVAESVTFLGEKDQLSVKAEGDLSKAFIEIKPDERTVIKTESDEKFKSKYSLEYLKKMIAGSKLSDQVSLHFNSDYPMKIEYKVKDKLLLSFILAPRVDNDWMGNLKGKLDAYFKEKALNEEPVYDSHKIHFCDLLREVKEVDKDDFSSVLNYVIDYFKVPIEDLQGEFGVSHGTMSRWRNGKSIPPSSVRQSVAQRIVDYVGR